MIKEGFWDERIKGLRCVCKWELRKVNDIGVRETDADKN